MLYLLGITSIPHLLPPTPLTVSVGFKFSKSFHFPDSPELYNIGNMATFGLTEVALTQLVVDGVKLLIIMEKRLEGSLSIDELVPAQK